MNDENKDKPDFHEEQHDHDDFEDTFEDAFGIDEAPEQDSLTPEEIETQKHAPEDETAIERPVKKSGSLLPVAIGIAVLGFLGWKLYGTFIEKSSEPTAQNERPTTQTPPPTDMATLPSYDTEPTTQPITPTPAPVPTQSAETPELMATAKVSSDASKEAQAEISKLQSRIDEQEKLHKQKIDALEKEIELTKQNAANASRALNSIQRDLTTLSTAIQQLGSQIGMLQQNQERQEIRRQQASAAKSKSSTKSADKLPSLTVYAIIPGRAWLRSANGKTISVTEGEPIAEYGKVLKIDASNGVVVTTSGVTLR